jgi:hypothetical protein
MSDLYYEKYTKYKNKYLKLKLIGGAKHNDEYTVCEIENKLLKKPSYVLIYTLQFPTFLKPEDEYSYQADNSAIIKRVKDLHKIFMNDFYIITTDNNLLHISPQETTELPHPNSMDDLLTPQYTHNFADAQRAQSEKILNEKKSELPKDYKGKLIMLRNGTQGFAASVFDFNAQTISHFKLVQIKTSNIKYYPYLNNERERNPEYMKLFLSSRAKTLHGSGASTIGYIKYYKNLGIEETNIKIIFNTDSEDDKKRAFSSLDSNSHVIFIGHCCRRNDVVSDNTIIDTQQGRPIVNPVLTAKEVVNLLNFIPRQSNTNKTALVNLNICDGHTKFVEGTLIDELNKVRINPLIISKTESVARFGGMETPVIEENIFNHTCGTPTMITFWNEKLGYTSVNANIFNISKETIFKND